MIKSKEPGKTRHYTTDINIQRIEGGIGYLIWRYGKHRASAMVAEIFEDMAQVWKGRSRVQDDDE